MEKTKYQFTLIIMAVGNYCNLRCGYCFHHNECQQEKMIMDIDLLEKIVSQFLATDQSGYKFIWHGGEPMLAGLKFYKQAISLQEKYRKPNQEIRNSIQTNATLVNEEWARFFKKNNFGVGVSLDGCKSSHDKFRVYIDGTGSFDDVLRGVMTLRSHDVKLGYIQTVAKDNLAAVDEDFKFFTEELKTESWGVNYYLDKSNGRMSDQTVTPEEMATHVIRNIDLWLKRDDDKLRIREIEHFFRPFLKRDVNHCDFSGSCGQYFCIDWKGGVTPCDRFSDSVEFHLGNLQRQDLAEIINSDSLKLHNENTAFYPNDCLYCKWLKYCRNGCVHLRIPDVRSKYFYCEARKKIFSYVEQLTNAFCICDYL